MVWEAAWRAFSRRTRVEVEWLEQSGAGAARPGWRPSCASALGGGETGPGCKNSHIKKRLEDNIFRCLTTVSLSCTAAFLWGSPAAWGLSSCRLQAGEPGAEPWTPQFSFWGAACLWYSSQGLRNTALRIKCLNAGRRCRLLVNLKI